MFGQNVRSLVFILALPCAAHAQTGPGGVGNSTTNVFWLRADRGVHLNAGTVLAGNGDNVQQWNDVSGNDKHASEATLGNRPNFMTNMANGLPAVRYTKANNDRSVASGITSGSRASVWVVARYSTLPSNNPGLVQGALAGNALSSDPANKNLGMWVSNTGSVWGRGIQTDGTSKNVPATTTLSSNTWYVLNANYDGSNITQYVNNAAAGSIAYNGTLRPWNEVAVGVQAGTEGWNGDIAEVIMYNVHMNTAQRIIVGNYLSAKYGTALGANDIYVHDNVGNGNYDHEVAGIGRVDASNIQNDSQGTGVVRISNPSNLGNNEFMLWGHNNGVLGTFGVSDLPTGVQGRWGRVWRVNEVNASGTAVDVGAVDMTFDLSSFGSVTASELRLLVDNNNNGSFNDDTPIAGATDAGGGKYVFTGVTALVNNVRFSLGTTSLSNTPLPVELVEFEAAPNGAATVRLDWATASENNNDRFVVERSTDLFTWEQRAHVPGVGNSTTLTRYSTDDHEAPHGDIYYRLRQVDTDGTTSLSSVRHVFLPRADGLDVTLHPNPSPGNFTVLFHGPVNGAVRFTFIDAAGRMVRELTTHGPSSSSVPFEVPDLPNGPYRLRIAYDGEVRTIPFVLAK